MVFALVSPLTQPGKALLKSDKEGANSWRKSLSDLAQGFKNGRCSVLLFAGAQRPRSEIPTILVGSTMWFTRDSSK